MIDTMLHRLNVTEEHRGSAAHAHLVPDPVHFEPFRGGLLAPADLITTP